MSKEVRAAHDADPSTEQTAPVGLDLRLKEQVLEIRWADGVESQYPLDYLRAKCPCAQCRTEREDTNPLKVLKVNPSADARVVDGRLMGNYALQLTWSDGHNTGIFDFRYLRSLDRARS